MFKKIDRYIVGKYLTTFFVIIALIIALASVFDFSERLDGFMGRNNLKPTVKEILLDYYLNFAIFFANMFAPFFAFIAVIFFTSRMASRLEIVSILSTGTSYTRFLWPYLLTAFLLAGANWLSANYIIPNANAEKMSFEKKYFGRVNFSLPNIHRQVNDSEFVYIKNFNFDTRIGGGFAFEKFRDGQLVTKIMCHNIIFDTVQGDWKLQDYIVRDMNGLNEKMRRGTELDTVFSFTPTIFRTETKTMITMSNRELDQFIKEEKAKGSKYVNIYLLEKHQRNANPFTIIIMTLLAVPIASRKVRGGTGLHLAMGVALAFLYIYLQKVCVASASTGGMAPLWAIWVPNIIFMVLVGILIRFAQK